MVPPAHSQQSPARRCAQAELEMGEEEQLALENGESTVKAASASFDTLMGLGAWPRKESASIIRKTQTYAMSSYIYLCYLHAARSHLQAQLLFEEWYVPPESR